MGQEATGSTLNTDRTREVSPGVMMMPSLRSEPQTMPLNSVATYPPSSLSSTQPINPIRAQTNEFGQDDAASFLERMPVTAFDEEVDLGGEEELEDLEQIRDLTRPERTRAKNVLSRLHEARGTTAANSSRLQVLNNVVSTQISKSQLQELIAGIWAVTALKKLKIDQVEALISWAKEDDFMSEVEAVLLLIEEDRYARGNR